MKQEELNQLLDRLGGDRETAGAEYNRLRRKLLNHFRLIGHSAPDEAADRALDITAAKLADGAVVQDVASYAFGVARLLGKEDQRAQFRLDKFRRAFTPPLPPDDSKDRLLKLCFARLPETERSFLLRYYAGANVDERARLRELLALELQATLNTLRLRAHRLRKKLRHCVRTCPAE
ncbi:MAG: hypothetical protein HYR56_20460 [Acidobacteria bacterium]|nr:hypothetical protein [Acidobacteriota bacterium]MBI3423278.1 hypothetical protein [Acidobacteriota bacterium]